MDRSLRSCTPAHAIDSTASPWTAPVPDARLGCAHVRAVTGSELLAHALRRLGVTDFFYLMGGPMLPAERACLDLGLRGIDVRHEQAAAMAAHAYARVRR